VTANDQPASFSAPPSTVLSAAKHRQYRWRNGLGESSEIAAEQVGTTISTGWRLSIATVEADLAFSSFPGMDRQLMALSQRGLDLDIDGKRRSLAQWEIASFTGEAVVSSVAVTVPTLDLNLMVDRNRHTGTLDASVVCGATEFTSPTGTTMFVVVLDGAISVGDRTVSIHDALRVEPAHTYEARGDATVAIARISAL
jgi:environmental stress-induced protein Ves